MYKRMATVSTYNWPSQQRAHGRVKHVGGMAGRRPRWTLKLTARQTGETFQRLRPPSQPHPQPSLLQAHRGSKCTRPGNVLQITNLRNSLNLLTSLRTVTSKMAPAQPRCGIPTQISRMTSQRNSQIQVPLLCSPTPRSATLSLAAQQMLKCGLTHCRSRHSSRKLRPRLLIPSPSTRPYTPPWPPSPPQASQSLIPP